MANPVSTLRWATRDNFADPGGRVVMVTGRTTEGRVADYNMAFTREEVLQFSPYFFGVMLERMQETILEFIT